MMKFLLVILVAWSGTSFGQQNQSDEVKAKNLAVAYEPVVVLAQSSSVKVAGNGSNTRIQYDNVLLDPYSAVTTGASWVFTAPRTAYYRVSANSGVFSCASNFASAEEFFIRFYVNGGQVAQSLRQFNTGDDENYVTGSYLATMNQGDTLYIEANQSSGGNCNLSTGIVQQIHISEIGVGAGL